VKNILMTLFMLITVISTLSIIVYFTLVPWLEWLSGLVA